MPLAGIRREHCPCAERPGHPGIPFPFHWLHLACAFWFVSCNLSLAAEPTPIPYRDLVVYTTSAPDTGNTARIVATTYFINRGKRSFELNAVLSSSPPLGFGGAVTTLMALDPGTTSGWQWAFSPTGTVIREVLKGMISLNRKPDRDLFIAVQGPDARSEPPLPKCELLTNRATVVATYVPRLNPPAPPPPRKGKTVVLAARGESDYVIAAGVLPDPGAATNLPAAWRLGGALTPPQSDLLDAIEDLQRCIRLQGGATVPVVFAAGTGPAIVLRIGDPRLPNRQDAYRLRMDGKNLVIEGKDLEGIRNGIYGLLTDHMGCRWFQPGELGEDIPVPADRTVRVPAEPDAQGSPWFAVGGMSWGSDPPWERRNRAFINRARMNFGHSWVGYISPNEFPYEKFPQYYARNPDGTIRKVDKKDEYWTSTNFCPSDTNVIAIVARKIDAMFDSNPEALVASLDPNDYAPMCLCDRCTSLDKQYKAKTLDGTDVADRLIHFLRAVHDRLRPEHQKKFLGILIYGYQMEMPQTAKPPEYQAGIICNFPPRYDHSRPWNDPTSPWNTDFYRLVRGWGGLLKQFGYYDYYGHYYYFGPFGVIHKMREDLPAFRELGGTFLMLENEPIFAAQGLNHYVSARLAWDLEADADSLMEEFFVRYYGPAADPMRRYWLGAERHFALERPGTHTEMRVASRPEFWQELDGYLKEAEAALPPPAEGSRRFADRVAFNRMGFDYGRLMFEYGMRYGDLAQRVKQPTDHAAAIRFLEEHGPRITALQERFKTRDAYWPPFVPSWSWLDVAAALTAHRQAAGGHPPTEGKAP